MLAWSTTETPGVLARSVRPIPDISDHELLVRVEACGVCRTDLHVIDGELGTHRAGRVPGHQIVGTVVRTGRLVTRISTGARVGIAWLRSTCGTCRWCRQGRENLCPDSVFTGWDVDGGFAEYTTVPEAYAYMLPVVSDVDIAAPLLCAGIIGFRALTRSALPPGGRLGLYGFGSSAHITATLARATGAELFVMTRGEENRALARSMGCEFVGDALASPPVPLDSALVFAPAGELVPAALRSTTRGGTVVLAGIHMSQIPAMDYQAHLFYERDLKSVTSNTRSDGDALLRVARALNVTPIVTRYPFERTADAVNDLRAGATSGSLVITGT